MTVEEDGAVAREVVAILHSPEDLEAAIDELLRSGFDRAEISLLAGEHAVEEKMHHRYKRAPALADDPRAPRAAFVSTAAIGDAQGALIGGLFYVGATLTLGAVVASGGALSAALAAATLAGGTGGLIGALLARRVGRHHAHYLQEQMERGGLLLWVRTADPVDEALAIMILKNHAGDNVHVHALAEAA